jgi:predicted nucleotidyltransferase
MANPNLALLEIAAAKLKPLIKEIVFVGGCATGLLITDLAAAAVRKTYDVDVIAEIGSYAEYALFSERLRRLRFAEDTSEDAPACRWESGNLKLDVMPLDKKILGFSNRWYKGALEESDDVELPNGITIRAITPPYFLGTKIEAFLGRGANDYMASHDLEDLIAVIDGRNSIAEEVQDANPDLRRFIGKNVARFLSETRFMDALPGFLLPDTASQNRVSMLIERLRRLAAHSK